MATANISDSLDAVRRHCRGNPFISKVNTPFQLFRKMRADACLRDGLTPDWKAIGHEWKHSILYSPLFNSLVGSFADNILETADDIVRDLEYIVEPSFGAIITPKPEYTDGTLGIIPRAIFGGSSFFLRFVPILTDTLSSHHMYLNGKEITVYFRNSQLSYPTFYPILLRDRRGGCWEIVLRPRASKLLDTYDEPNPCLAIYNGMHSHTFHGRLISENLY